jgi:hypothetical protein
MGASGLTLTKKIGFFGPSPRPLHSIPSIAAKSRPFGFPDAQHIEYILIFSQKIEQPHCLDPPFLMSANTPNSTHPFGSGKIDADCRALTRQ